MGKIKLGERPTSIKTKVEVGLPEGGKGHVTMEFVYRTRKELGALLDEIVGEAKSSGTPEEMDITIAQALERSVESNADYIMRIASGWDLDAEYTRDNVISMCNQYPGVALAVMTRYREAMGEGKAGN